MCLGSSVWGGSLLLGVGSAGGEPEVGRMTNSGDSNPGVGVQLKES